MYPSSFAVFPFLKTSAPVALPGVTLHSTEDVTHLGPEDAKHVTTIAAMLFLKDNPASSIRSLCEGTVRRP